MRHAMCVCAQLCLTFCDPMDVACQTPLFMGFSRQENWSGFPFPSPGDLPNPGIKLVSPTSLVLTSGFFTTEPLKAPMRHGIISYKG